MARYNLKINDDKVWVRFKMMCLRREDKLIDRLNRLIENDLRANE